MIRRGRPFPQMLFVTGTDTGVGKTLVACALARAMADEGRPPGVMKPVETGCPEKQGRLVPGDALRLRSAARLTDSLDRINPYRFHEALAPSIAAERAGVRIRPDVLLRCAREWVAERGALILEGAGGLMVPLASGFDMGGLAGRLGASLLIVAESRLGALNHTLLTLSEARRRGLPVVGVVLNRAARERSLAARTNAEALRDLLGPDWLGEVPYLPKGETDPGAAARALPTALRFRVGLGGIRAISLPRVGPRPPDRSGGRP